jgi:DNA-binding response OmpR family regulator
MRILFAEDDRQLRASVIRGLREASYATDQATTGAQALSLAATNEYDVVILDVLLPGKDGLEVCREIRRRGDRVPILMLTALDAIEHRIAGLDAGADDYLTKPFDFGELLARLRALTRRGAEAHPMRIEIGDLVVDIAEHTVRRGRREISLTATEFAFLAHLARNAGRAVGRAELLKHVWDDSSSYSNVIDVYASRVRRKIDDGEKVHLFITVRGVGFTLRTPADKPSKKSGAVRAARKPG